MNNSSFILPQRAKTPPEKKKKAIRLNSIRYVLKNIVWPRKKLLLIGLILIFINRFSGLILPGASKILLDEVIPHKNGEFLTTISIVVIIAVFIQALTSFVLTRLLSVEAQHLISGLRVENQEHVLHFPLRFFDDTQSGALVSRIMNDPEGVRNLVGTGLVHLVGGSITAVVAFILLVRIHFWMTIYALIPLLVFALISAKVFSFLRPAFTLRRKITSEVTGRLTESLGGIRVIKGFRAEEVEKQIFKTGVESLFESIKKTLTGTSLLTSAATLLIGLASVIIMFQGGSLILEGQLTIGDFFAFTLYLAFLVSPILQMADIGTQMTDAFSGLDRMEELLKMVREEEDPLRVKELNEFHGTIRFQDVCFHYDEGKPVLQNISFEAKAGSVVALVGSSGSGKTTIASLAASFLNPTQGEIFIDEVSLATVKLSSYRSYLGVVLQDDFLFEGTIRENILFAKPQATEEEIQKAIQAAYVNEFTDRFEEGVDTRIGERGIKLSGGQRQRIAIARALLANPKILLLDEATSNLDTESELFIQKSLSHLLQGRTTLVIAHRLSTIRQADQILVLEKGKIVERGRHEELIEKQGRYYQLYTYQARI
jgi:ABC-type multidrug transport system fused ATPase/permease subunit